MGRFADIALPLVRRGFHVFPQCWPDASGRCACGRGHTEHIAKIPLPRQGFKDCTNREDTVINYFGKEYPDANVGITTGKDTGDLALDFDAKAGGLDVLARLQAEHSELDTFTVKSGAGGLHFHYRYPEGVKWIPSREIERGFEVKADGGCITGPGSIHQNGNKYEIVRNGDIKQLPGWLLAIITKPSPKRSATLRTGEPIPEHERNATLISIGGKLRRDGMTEDEIDAALQSINQNRCQPPLPETEVSRVAHSAAKYKPGGETCDVNTEGKPPLSDGPKTTLEDAVLALIGVCDGAIEKDGQCFNKLDADLFHSLAESIRRGEPIADELRPRVKRRIVKYANQLTKLGININDMLLVEEQSEQNDAQGYEVKEALIPRLAKAILQDNHFAQDQGGKLYRYHEGVYKSRGAVFVSIQVKTLLDSWGEIKKWSSHLAEEVFEFIRVDSPILWERPPLDTVNALNGLLNVNTLELKPHSPDFLSCVQIPVTYDPTATCPAWDKFISEIFPEDAFPLGYEIPAYLMIPDTSVQKSSIILLGEGGNGKSTYLEAVRVFLGRGNTASLSLQKVESDRFAVARLVGKLANICPDLPSEHLAGTSIFKTITGGDTVTAEYKFQDSFDFVPYARLVFSANHPPQSSDSSQAFFDRWLVVPFNIRFRGEKAEIHRSVLDARLACPYELSGVLNKALIALKQIHAHFGFTESKTMKAAWDEFRATTDPLAVWLSEATIESPDAIVAKCDLTTAYNIEAEHKGQPCMTATGFGIALHRLRPNLQDAQRTVAGKVTWVWLGIGLKSKESTTNGDNCSHGSRS